MVKLLKKLIANKNETASLTASTNFQLYSASSIIFVQVSSFGTHFGYIAVGTSQHMLASAWWSLCYDPLYSVYCVFMDVQEDVRDTSLPSLMTEEGSSEF